MPARAAIRAVQPLPLLTHDGLRKVRVQLTDGDADGCRLVILDQDRLLLELACLALSLTLFLPDADPGAPQALVFRLVRGNEVLDEQTVAWQPAKRWQVPLVLSSHEDLGYVEYANRLPRVNAGYLDRAMRLAAKSDPDLPFRYLIEHAAWLFDYADNRPPEAMQPLQEAFGKGVFELVGIHSGVHTHWHSTE